MQTSDIPEHELRPTCLRLWDWMRRHPLRAIVLVGSIAFVAASAFGFHYRTALRASHIANYFFAVLTGNWNWSHPDEAEITDVQYMYGVAGAFLLNVGAYGFLIVLVWNLLREGRRRALLEIKQVFSVLDATSKGVLLETFTPKELWHAKDLSETDLKTLGETEAKIDASLTRIKGQMVLTLIDHYGRGQVDTVFGKHIVDEWLAAVPHPSARPTTRRQIIPSSLKS